MPSMKQHARFVRDHPYRDWWLIYDAANKSNIVGSVYVSFDNSIGFNVDIENITFSADYFMQILENKISPLPSEPSKIFGDFYFNVSPNNTDLLNWLECSNYRVSQMSLIRK